MGYDETVSELLRADANVDINFRSAEGDSALHMACRTVRVEFAYTDFASRGTYISLPNRSNICTVYFCTFQVECVYALLQRNPSGDLLNGANYLGHTALGIAAQTGEPRILQALNS